METQMQTEALDRSNMKQSSSRNSDAFAHLDSPHSSLRFHSPLRSDVGDAPELSPFASPENSPDKVYENPKKIITVDKTTQSTPKLTPLADRQKPPENHNTALAKSPSPSSVVMFNRAMRDEMHPSVPKVGPAGVGGGDDGRSSRGMSAILRRSRKEEMVKRAALGFRLSEVVLCLISFSVMAADKTEGWSGDSFDRYNEYRYCLSVTIIAFVYSGFQACDLAYNLLAGKQFFHHYLRCHFDFFMDQILAYLLISALSCAATRVDDWQSNWGKDEFTEMASASVSMAFLAFIAFAISSLISGYNLCSSR